MDMDGEKVVDSRAEQRQGPQAAIEIGGTCCSTASQCKPTPSPSSVVEVPMVDAYMETTTAAGAGTGAGAGGAAETKTG